MKDSDSAQMKIQIRMKKSGIQTFLGQLIAQEFELKSSSGGKKFLSWNESILEPMSENTNSPKWTEKDVVQNLTGLQRNSNHSFVIHVITQMSSQGGEVLADHS